jgi:hypothetical protein
MNTHYHKPRSQTSTRASILRAALEYADEDVRVFPCKPGGKAPLIKDWPNRATTDKSQITAWLNYPYPSRE